MIDDTASSISPSSAAPTPQQKGNLARPRRILFIEANEDGSVGGSHRALFDLVTGLDRARFEPVVLFYESNPFLVALRNRAIEAHAYDQTRADERAVMQSGSVRAKIFGNAAAVRRRIRLLREWRIDMVHLNNWPPAGSFDWIPAARLLGIPCISNVMGDFSKAIRGPLHGWLFRRFDHYLPISSYTVEIVQRLGVSSDRMDLVYLGVDSAALRQRVRWSREDVRTELGLTPGRLLAVMVGNVREWKGQHVVLEALAQMPENVRRRLKVAFAGAVTRYDHEYMSHLDGLIRQFDLEECVTFLGARDDVPDLLNAADFAIHASTTPEPFGLVVIEAMALGTPVIAANSGGPAEILQIDCGITHDPSRPADLAGALSALIDDPERRGRLGAGALHRAEDFEITRYVANVEAVYERVLARGARRRPFPPVMKRLRRP